MLTALSMFRTGIAESIFYDDIQYITFKSNRQQIFSNCVMTETQSDLNGEC